ncbi:MAG: discoidin domain-containing protein, partial [Akkermansiaceae bacterium]|nr:discoidin domain-containing protein [Akkermansiaceae bacterium]
LGSLRAIVRKAVSPQPLMRYANGQEMAAALGEWLESAKKGTMKFKTGDALPARAIAPAAAPPAQPTPGGNFGVFSLVGLLVMALIGAGIWFAMQDDEEEGGTVIAPAPAGPATPVEPQRPPAVTGSGQPAPQTPPEKPPAPTPEAIKTKYRKLLAGVREEVIAARLENRNALEAAIVIRPNWDPYFALVDDELHLLPRTFPAGNRASINTNLLTKHAIRNQEQIHDDHYFALETLTRDCLAELKAAGVKPEREVSRTWEACVEWLGLSPLHVLALTLAGEWEMETGAAVVAIDGDHKARVSLGAAEFSGEGVVETSKDGEIRIARVPGDPSRKWFLRWRNDTLVGMDETGAECTFIRRDPAVAANRNPEPGKQPDRPPGDGARPWPPEITEPALLELQEKYHAALEAQIGSMVSGYRSVLTKALALAERRDNIRSIDQLNAEIRRLDEIPWKTGRVRMEDIEWDDEIPLSYQGKKSIFDRSFREKMDRLQTAYVDELRKLRAEFRGKRKDSRQVEHVLEQFELPPGTVRARYVKLQAEEAEGVNQAVISELEILDARGEPIPRDSMEIHGTSSTQGERQDNPARSPELVLDGKPQTFWHTTWSPERADFPHWIAIDMRGPQVIGGFRVLPRQQEWQRGGDLRRWVLFTSLDGEEWREVARGGFPKTSERQEFRFAK